MSNQLWHNTTLIVRMGQLPAAAVLAALLLLGPCYASLSLPCTSVSTAAQISAALEATTRDDLSTTVTMRPQRFCINSEALQATYEYHLPVPELPVFILMQSTACVFIALYSTQLDVLSSPSTFQSPASRCIVCL